MQHVSLFSIKQVLQLKKRPVSCETGRQTTMQKESILYFTQIPDRIWSLIFFASSGLNLRRSSGYEMSGIFNSDATLFTRVTGTFSSTASCSGVWYPVGAGIYGKTLLKVVCWMIFTWLCLHYSILESQILISICKK